LTLVATLATTAPAVAADGQKPFIWPTRGKVTQQYGCTGFIFEPRYGNCRHFHGGIDIASARGTPIRAAAAGIVSHVGWDPWGTRAWMVIINHGGDVQSWYAHLRGKRVAGLHEGTRVRQGQLIGYMSDTGLATGVHLHWAVLKAGRYVNPRTYTAGAPYRPRAATPCDDIWIASISGSATAVVVDGNDNGAGTDISCAA
jgi:murein DD-endopeptidase MepM/ murein hydrolase activator NlpD